MYYFSHYRRLKKNSFSSSIRVTYARLSAGGLGYDGNADPNIPEAET